MVDVDVRVGAFRGRYEANLEVGDFLEFGRRLRSLGASLKGEASFPCIEPWLSIRIFPDRLGHLTAECEATDALFRGARLEFRLDLDQTFIPPTVDALDNIARAFPLAEGPES